MEKGKKLNAKKTCAYTPQAQQEPEDTSGRLKMSKEEKKARRLLSQLNIIPMLGFKRVVMRRTDNTLIIIDDPELYRPANSDTYIVFGHPRCQEPLEHAQQAVAQRFKFEDLLPHGFSIHSSESSDDSGDDDDDHAKETAGMNMNDIDIIMSQSNASRKKAIKAYKQYNYDIVNAIMNLTK